MIWQRHKKYFLGIFLTTLWFASLGCGAFESRPPDQAAPAAPKEKVVVLGQSLAASAERQPVAPAEIAGLKEALAGDDEAKVAELLKAQNIKKILVGTDVANPALLPKVTVASRLSLNYPMKYFHALRIKKAGTVYEVVEPWNLNAAEQEQALKLARLYLAGEKPDFPILPKLAEDHATQLAIVLRPQGEYLIYRFGEGETVRAALQDAASRIQERWQKYPAQTRDPGGRTGRHLAYWQAREKLRHMPIAEALKQLRIEVAIVEDQGVVEGGAELLAHTADGGGTEVIRDREYFWRAVEPGIYGLTFKTDNGGRARSENLLPSESVYGALDQHRRMTRSLLKMWGASSAYERRKLLASHDFKIERFRTQHFRDEKAGGGGAVALLRGYPLIGEEAINREGFLRAIGWSIRWLIDNLGYEGPGTYIYKYFSGEDKTLAERVTSRDQYNIVRHVLATYSLFLAYEYFHQPEVLKAAETALDYVLDHVIFGPDFFKETPRRIAKTYRQKPWGPADPRSSEGFLPAATWQSFDGYERPVPQNMAFVEHRGAVKMGTVAGALMAIAAHVDSATGTAREKLLKKYRPYLEGFGEFFLFMQKPDGSFNHYFVTPNSTYYKFETTIYPGEIMFGLARLYELLGDERYLQSFTRAHKAYQAWWERESAKREPDGTYVELRRVDLVQFVPWISMAENAIVPLVKDESLARDFARFGVDVSLWMVDTYQFTRERTMYPDYLGGYYKIATELPAMHGCVYTEGTASAYKLAMWLKDQAASDKLGEATLLGARFAAHQVTYPGISDIHAPNPKFMRGGVRYSLNQDKLRIDYTYHSLSALYQTLKFFDRERLPAKPAQASFLPDPPGMQEALARDQ